MAGKPYEPGPPAEVEAHRESGERWTLVFVRELRHAPEKVWEALTDPDELLEWAPFDADRNLGTPGDATLTMAPDGEAMPATVRRAERPRVLEYTWGEDVLRWELEPIATGTRLTLHHTVSDRTWLSKVAAGWQICIEIMERALSGERIGRIVAQEAMEYGWEGLERDYARRLGG